MTELLLLSYFLEHCNFQWLDSFNISFRPYLSSIFICGCITTVLHVLLSMCKAFVRQQTLLSCIKEASKIHIASVKPIRWTVLVICKLNTDRHILSMLASKTGRSLGSSCNRLVQTVPSLLVSDSSISPACPLTSPSVTTIYSDLCSLLPQMSYFLYK